MRRGFTLMELLVVIVIIVVIAGIAMPAMSGFVKQRRLKAAVNIIQSACFETRARAIAQRETQFLLCFAAAGPYQPPSPWRWAAVPGEKGAMYSYKVTRIVVAGQPQLFVELVGFERLPEFTAFAKPAVNFALAFYGDGTIAALGFADATCDDLEAVADADMDKVDIVIEQSGLAVKGLLDVVANTGLVLGVVK